MANPAVASAVAAPAADGVVIDATRWLALGSVIGLIVLGLAWELWLAPTGSGTLALKVLPLFIPLRGLWRSTLRTYRWLSLTVWLYFIEGVVRAYGDQGVSALLAGIEIGLCLLLFIACALQVRERMRRDRPVAVA
jgi:uncharacterized membrane protein